jgi:hypothetical protein
VEEAPPRSALRASLGRLLRSPRSALRASLGRLRRTHGPTSANRARGAVRGALTRRAGALRPRPRGATWGRPSDRLAAPTRQTACIAHMWSRLHGAHGGNGDPMPRASVKVRKCHDGALHPREKTEAPRRLRREAPDRGARGKSPTRHPRRRPTPIGTPLVLWLCHGLCFTFQGVLSGSKSIIYSHIFMHRPQGNRGYMYSTQYIYIALST